jgi:hypothetical protein
MRTLTDLTVFSSLTRAATASSCALTLAACVPDFSPDPSNNAHDLDEPDGGSQSADARTDAIGKEDDAQLGSGGDGSGARDASMPRPDAMETSAGGPCNLSGRWFINERLCTDLLSAIQVTNQWWYVEIAQTGDQLTFDVATACGDTLAGAKGSLPAGGDDQDAWPTFMKKLSYGGRKGTVTETVDGCDVHVEKDYWVRGATPEAYKDPSVALPKLPNRANGSTPGWEDWEQDGKPGFTINLSGLASGAIYLSARTWTEYMGTIPKAASTFVLGGDWGQEREVLGSSNPDPLGILQTTPANAGQAAYLPRIEWAKLSDEQAAGDDQARCERLRAAAATLTPNAAEP